MFYDRSAFCQLVGYFGDACDLVDLPAPTVLKPLELWTGKQLFSMLIRPNADTKYVNQPVVIWHLCLALCIWQLWSKLMD